MEPGQPQDGLSAFLQGFGKVRGVRLSRRAPRLRRESRV